MKKKYILFSTCFTLLFCLFFYKIVHSYYDAKIIYDEEKPAVVDEERKKLREENEVLILLYHNVTKSKNINDDLYVNLEDFRKQLDYLVDNNYNVITLEELYSLRQSNSEIPDKTIILTFDDGNKSSYEIVYPELQKRGLRASFFITTRQLNDKGFVTKDNIIEMHNAGHDIQSQGYNDEDFINSSLAVAHKSIYLGKKMLEEILNKKILFLVYPNSSFNSEIIRLAQDVGYEWALSTESGLFYDHYLVAQRVSIPGGCDFEEYLEILKTYNY